MHLLTAVLASFLAVAAANPLAARNDTIHCDALPFLVCNGGIDQVIACDDVWHFQCPGNGLHPVISNATCAAECVCEIPCPV
ncbi:hypothetical protein FB451DRAFT_1394833 [Mycena latifolia]|nr:hypothetical protein FB451DRAFT_1394833 [Mycena latifolia]